jgi:enediyne biosynthesis protein E7
MSTATSLPELRVHRSARKALRRFDADRLGWLDRAAALGPLVALRMGPLRTWIISDPEIARSILVADSGAWTRPPTTVVPIRLAIGENLFTQADKAWALLQPEVAPSLRKRALDARLTDLDAVIAREVDAIPLDTAVDLEVAMGRVALVLAAWVMFGETIDGNRAEDIARHQREAVGWVGRQVGKLNGFIPLAWGEAAREMRRHTAVLRAYADELIEGGRERGDDDVLGALVAARPGGRPLRPDELRSHVLGLLLAGNETTAAALSWALVHGARNPEAWRQVRMDPARHVPPYVTETLRLTPAVWGIPRVPTRAGVTLSAGGAVSKARRGQVATIYLRGMNRDPSRWPDPLRFDPGRHDAARPDADAARPLRALLPFGLGPRGCIGQYLALAEMEAVLPALARRGDVVIEGEVVEDASFALRVRGGLRGRLMPVGGAARGAVGS